MTLVRWEPFGFRNPWGNMMRMHRQMDRLLNWFTDDAEEAPLVTYRPRVNVTDFEDRIEVSAELPGLNRDDIKVEVNDNILTLSGEKKEVQEKKDRNLYLCERAYGSFRRSFQLPSQVKADEIGAEFKDGVLTVTLPKEEKAKAKQIEIRVK